MEDKYHNISHLVLTLVFMCLSVSLVEPTMLWISVLVAGSCAMQITLFLDWHSHQPSHRTINLLAMLCAVVLAYTGLQIGLLLSMVNLLIMASALKLMQLRTNRDYYLLICTQLFIIGCGLIFQQSILFSLFYAVMTLLLLVSLAFHISPSRSIRFHIKMVLKLSLQAVPICILMFLVLPKIDPLWQMPRNKGAETGLSETVNPGDISELSQSDDLAFRAAFTGDIPLQNERYWRALVFEDFDGMTWRVSPLRKKVKITSALSGDTFKPTYDFNRYFEYEVIAEPTDQVWLYSLDVPLPISDKVWLSHDFQIQHRFPVITKYKYEMRSYPDSKLMSPQTYFDRNINLQLPSTGNPQTQQWVANLRKIYPDDAQFIQRIEQYFLQNPFEYTLRPEPMPFNPVDKFLFDAQAGFCAHYASAYAYIMRLAGIPARMVGGYQGGEMRGDEYMSVYQYDAHAWVEIWHPENGWQRKDPTALIAPERINFGLQQAVAHENSFLEDSTFALAKLKGLLFFNELRLLIADMDYFWSSWILGFDQDKQLELFQHLIGEIKPTKVAMLLLGALIIIGLFLLLFNYQIWFPQISNKPLHFYNKALATLAKHGLQRKINETPSQFLTRCESSLTKECYQELSWITQTFSELQYQNPNTPDSLLTEKENALLERSKGFAKSFRTKSKCLI